jgi:hypothetical protein
LHACQACQFNRYPAAQNLPGVIGGLSPLAVAAIKANLPGYAHTYAPAIWLACLGGISVVGTIGLMLYQPRLAKPHVGKIE